MKLKHFTFKKVALASAIGSIMAAGSAQAAVVGYSMYDLYNGSNKNLADLPINDVPVGAYGGTANASNNPAHGNYKAPTDWRNAAGTVITSPAYGWANGGGLPATWYVGLGANDSANVNSTDFRSARAAGGFSNTTSGGSPSPYGLRVAPASWLDWGTTPTGAVTATNWGHHADFGLLTVTGTSTVTINVSPLLAGDTHLVDPVNGIDGILGFTLWKGWGNETTTDAGTRHQAFKQNGAPGGTGWSYSAGPFRPDAQSMTLGGNVRGGGNGETGVDPMVAGTDYSSLVVNSGLGLLPGGVGAFTQTTGGQLSITLNDLAAGNYYFSVGGASSRIGNTRFGAPVKGLTTDPEYKVSFTSTAVPVPAAAWLFGPALAGLIGVGRRKGKQSV